jgi:hypothetical protein
MGDTLASFRELKGIGPATEARLHETGIYTWDALATAAAALAAVRGDGDTLRDVLEAVAERRAEDRAATDGLPGNSERLESFVLRLTVAADGQPRRSQLTHVRTMAEQTWAGWVPAEVASFIEGRSGVRPEMAAVEEPPGQGRSPAGRRATASHAPASADHVLLLDAGKAIGGADRDINLVVTNTRSARGDFGYRATLAARQLGEEGHGGGWTTVGSRRGTGSPAQEVSLAFPAVRLPHGVHRLQLRLEVQLATPAGRPPALALA